MEWLSSLAENSFYEFALLFLIAAVFGAVGQFFKQPLIVMFIAVGIISGPSFLNIVKSWHNIELLAELGIAILLFIVGLNLDLRLIKSIGKVAILTGLGQVLFTSAIGFGIGMMLGFTYLHSFYIAVGLTFSSTIIIVKLLSDKKEIDSLHGQIAIGFLIVQDIVVILVMVVLSAMTKDNSTSLANDILVTLLSSLALVAATLAVMKWIIPHLSFFLAKSREMLALFAVAWAVTLAAVSDLIGFSLEVGAFLAGVSLASSTFRENISTRMVSLRDFLLLFFFVNMGSTLDFSAMGSQVPAAIIFSLFVLIGNPIIVLIIMGRLGYKKRTAFFAGLTVAQISEFSLIFARLGLDAGHIDDETLGLITLVGIITIGLSTYLILYSQKIYELVAPALSIFEKGNARPGSDLKENKAYDIIIFGIGRFGNSLANHLEKHPGVSYLGVDLDPEKVRLWQEKQKDVQFGDIGDPEILDNLPYQAATCIVSTIPHLEYSAHLIKSLNKENYKGKLFITALHEEDAKNLPDFGDMSVLIPQKMAAENLYKNSLEGLLK